MPVDDFSAPTSAQFEKSPLRSLNNADLDAGRVKFRLSKTPEEIERELLADQEEDWSPFVLGAANAALLLFGVQALAAVIVGHNLGAVVEIRFWNRFLPYIAFVTDRPTFVGIVTWSTAIATAAVCFGLIVSLIRNRETRIEQLRLMGWGAGLFMAAGLVIFQFVRHLINPPVINGWVSAQATAFIIVTALIFVAFKPAAVLPEPLDAAAHEAALKDRKRAAEAKKQRAASADAKARSRAPSSDSDDRTVATTSSNPNRLSRREI